MTKEAFLKQVESLTDEQFEIVSPFLEADIEAVGSLSDLRNEIAIGRKNAISQPLLDSNEVFERIKKSLSS